MNYKKLLLNLIAGSGLLFSGASYAQTADIQIIHNSADPAAALVDVYVNGTIALDDFAFRTATDFLQLPAGVPLNIGVAPGNSTSANDTLKNFEVTLAAGNRYVAVANGVLNPANFAANPDGNPTAFTLFIKDNIQTVAVNPSNVEFVVLHGASDAPSVDVIARGIATIVDSAAYSDFTGYISVPPASYILDITPAAGAPILVSYQADLSSLTGGTAVVFASGFLDPSQNQTGEAFGLFVALSDGTVLPLSTISQARLQIIHNAADPDAAAVDIYVDGVLALDNFVFRSATPYIDVTAGTPVNIGIAGPFSNSVNDTIKNFEVTFQNGNTYVAIANGLLTPSNFVSNPDGISTAFTLLLKDQTREAALTSSSFDFIAVHGSTDAPTVDIAARNVATLVFDAAYTDITDYVTVPTGNYILDVTLPGGSPIVASYEADVTTLGGSSAVVFASGFLDPANNLNGEAFGLFAAFADGTVAPLTPISQARLQVIHNCADPAAAQVDVYVNGSLVLDDFAFRTGTPYIDIPADVLLNIGIAPSSSASVNDTLKNFEVTLQNGNTYVAIASGVLNPANFLPHPQGRPTAFTLLVADQLRENSLNTADVDFIPVHGVTDVPTVDILAGTSVLVNNINYSDIQSYISVPASTYTLNITPGNANSIIYRTFLADITPYAGLSAIILASGFDDPAQNQNGEDVALFAVFSDGSTEVFTNVTGLADVKNDQFTIAPNPASAFTVINFNEPAERGVITLTNQLGQVLQTENVAAGTSRIQISTQELSRGIYFIRLQNESGLRIEKLIVQ